MAAGAAVRPEVVRALADCWNTGHKDGSLPSHYQGPVLLMRGAHDTFVTEDVVTGAVTPRLATVECVAIPGAGHWAHVERPRDVAGHLSRFLTRTAAAPD